MHTVKSNSMKIKFLPIALMAFLLIGSVRVVARDITFCGEVIPVQDRFVADKLMNVLRRQMNYVNMPDLRKRINMYFGQVEYYLKQTGLPEDFKYLAIVESGFKNAISPKGAAGFWQLMPETARELGLIVSDQIDERNDFNKATLAACKVLANYYLYIKKKFGISSWVLTAAAYNNGIGNIQNAIKKQGKDYFQMNLNAETAVYVYKIIAVKELFEYPELYMKNFGYNVFTTSNITESQKIANDEAGDANDFENMTVKVNEADGDHPDAPNANTQYKKSNVDPEKMIKFVSAQITGKYKNFKDGDLVSLKLIEDLQVQNRFTAKKSIIQGRAWLIDDRWFIDLGYDHDVVLLDLTNKKGVEKNSLNKKELVILKVTEHWGEE